MLIVIILIPKVKVLRWFLTAALLLGLASFSYSMSRPLTMPIPMEFVRIVYEKDARAIVIEWIVPQGWNHGRYIIKARAGQRKHIPTSWQELAEFDYSGAGVENVKQSGCLIFIE